MDCPCPSESCNGRCRLLDTMISLVCQLLSERDIITLQHLSASKSYSDYISNISRRIDSPYMSVKRTLDLLISLKLVRSDERVGASYNYYRLTVFGRALAGKVMIPVTSSF